MSLQVEDIRPVSTPGFKNFTRHRSLSDNQSARPGTHGGYVIKDRMRSMSTPKTSTSEKSLTIAVHSIASMTLGNRRAPSPTVLLSQGREKPISESSSHTSERRHSLSSAVELRKQSLRRGSGPTGEQFKEESSHYIRTGETMVPTLSQEDTSSVPLYGLDDTRRRRGSRYRGRRSWRFRSDSISSTADDEETLENRKRRLRVMFKKAATIIRRVSQMGLCMKRLSKENVTSTLVAQLHYFSADGNSQSLAFDKAKYLRSNLFLPQWARQIGTKPPQERTPDEIYKLYSVMKNMKSFDKFTQKIRLQICKMARYTCCEKGRVIVRQGHIGYNFYFIYAGSVFVQLEFKDARTGVVTANTLNVICKGQSFGELALLGDGRRTASIICREPTELFEIEKDIFLEYCPDMFEAEMAEKVATAKKHELFRYWPDANIQRLCFESQILEVPHSKIVDKDTSNSPNIYFVLKGKILLLREFSIRDAAKRSEFQLSVVDSRPLPHPVSRGSTGCDSRATIRRITDACTCFCSIGNLQDGECSDLSAVRHGEPATVPGLILVSHGVRLMTIVKRRLESLAPRGSIEAFKKRYEPHIYVPSDADLYRKYIEDANWDEFKNKVVDTLMDEKHGRYISHRPATAKGSSGWAKWPGSGKMNNTSTLYQSQQRRAVSTLPSRSLSQSRETENKRKVRLLRRPKTAPSSVQVPFV
ncbi:cyclic nucleotide-binding domain-containing protein 2-like [Saccoglossus kowalevskii]